MAEHPERVAALLERIEHELRVATGWVVFEPNTEALWARVRAEVAGRLVPWWRHGELRGAPPDPALVVRCDRTTMTRDDLGAGRLVVLVGAATARPSEFDSLRVDQWTDGAWRDPAGAFLDRLVVTRDALHGVAEGVMAGPQHAASGTIRLRPQPTGFGTVAVPALQVRAGSLVLPDDTLVPLAGTTYADLARAAGVDWRLPDLYGDHADAAPDDEVAVDPALATVLGGWFDLADRALRAFAPDETPVLWPEHFDVAVAVDGVTFGCSAGDDWSPEPYAYVAPYDRSALDGAFWDAPFGAARSRRVLRDVESVLAFFEEGRTRARSITDP